MRSLIIVNILHCVGDWLAGWLFSVSFDRRFELFIHLFNYDGNGGVQREVSGTHPLHYSKLPLDCSISPSLFFGLSMLGPFHCFFSLPFTGTPPRDSVRYCSYL